MTLNANKYRFLGLLILFTAIFSFFPSTISAQQAPTSPVTLTVTVGFDSVFRAQNWLPVVVTARNNGASVNGQLVIRPETSGAALNGTFSTPISLAEGATQTATIAITAATNLTQVRVELIDDQGVIVSSASANVRWIQNQDLLYAVITESALGAIDLTGVRFAQGVTYQTSWTPAQLPDRVGMLDALNLILVSDADTSRFTPAQLNALENWVASGGHLIVTGGANGQATASGIAHLLPVSLENTTTIDTLAPLADWLARPSDALLLTQSTIMTRGTLRDGAQMLVTASDEAQSPLIARQLYGDGTIDYLSVDPLSQPLRGWQNLGQLWLSLISSVSPQLSWERPLTNWDNILSATQIVPGYNPMPDIGGIFLFLAAYILLISPINYIILKAINRREWAWVTIPIFIILFTVISQLVGSNLRGNDAILNRISIVRAWDNLEHARADSFIGLLSPIRTQYNLIAQGGEILQPISRASLFNPRQSNVEIQQTNLFRAQNFSVDASFVMPFATSAQVERPALTGTATLSAPDSITSAQVLRGSVRNDTAFAIHNPVILARGTAHQLADVIEAGEILPFEVEIIPVNRPAPNRRVMMNMPSFQTYTYNQAATEQTIIDILTPAHYTPNTSSRWMRATPEIQVSLQRQQFLSGIMKDGTYTTGRGDGVYLAAWSDMPTIEMSVEGLSSRSQDSTLYLIELSVTLDQPADIPTRIISDRFTWVALEQSRSSVEFAPIALNMQNGDHVVFRFTPLPTAVLSQVNTIRIFTESVSSNQRNLPLDVYNWRTAQWDAFAVSNNSLTITDPADYLGANNAVDVRIVSDAIGGSFLRIGALSIEQTGLY